MYSRAGDKYVSFCVQYTSDSIKFVYKESDVYTVQTLSQKIDPEQLHENYKFINNKHNVCFVDWLL